MGMETKRKISKVLNLTGFILGAMLLILHHGLKLDITGWTEILRISEIFALLLLFASHLISRYELVSPVELKKIMGLLWPVIPVAGWLIIAIAGIINQTMFFNGLEFYLAVGLVFQLVIFSFRSGGNFEQPTRALLVSFMVLIIGGATVLMFPGMHKSNISLTDAVFTATSAVCVTGLSVCDTAKDFTVIGQMAILGLIQLGGLGIMIYGAMFAVLLGSRLSIQQSVALRDILNEDGHGNISSKIKFICLSTFIIEFVGMLFLLTVPDESYSGFQRIFWGVFHSISAFCNAGFSLQSDSLCQYRGHWQTYFVFCPLIIIGGLGFPVLADLRGIKNFYTGKRFRLTLHSKLVLTTTLILLVSGTVMLMVCSTENVSKSGENSSFLDNVFNSVTARTAGFNTVDIGKLCPAYKLVMIGLMCIGGSPASTAGGIKTVAIAIMFLTIISTIRSHNTVDVYRRQLSMAMVRRSLVLVAIYCLLLWLVTFGLIFTENSPEANALDMAFEAASAIGTVGLTCGITPELSVPGKWLIIFSMLIGRLGPLSLLTAITINARKARFEYPNEPVIIG